MNIELEQRVAERTAQLEVDLAERRRLENALMAADQRKDEFLAMLSHELRNPLAPIRNAVQIMGLKPLDDPHLRQCRDVIERQVEHLSRLVDDLLDVSRITGGRFKLEKKPVEVATFIARAIETAKPLFDARGQRLHVSMSDERLIVDGDLTRLSQIVGNLLNNAAKYTPDGGQISLRIETASRGGGSPEELMIRVKDNGTGIPPHMLPEVFDLFTQVDQGLDRSHGGLGIGLALVRKLVEMHGGSVDAHSDGVGHGSEFFVRLPCRIERVDVKGAPASAGDAIKTPVIQRRVLVVDDNEDSAETLALALQLEGCDVETAYGGQQALELAERFLPQLVLLDIGMPGMDGYEVARSIRAQPWGADMLLVAQTGWGQEEDRRRTREAGFDAHMTKPLDYPRLMSLMAQLPAPPRSAGIAAG